MKKRVLSILLVLVMAVGIFGVTASAEDPLTAVPISTPLAPVAWPTAATVLVNGEKVAFDAYTINDNNYFKLRDLAYILSGTEKQFEVSWDEEANAISLTKDKAYTTVGGEMTGKGEGKKTPTATDSKIFLNEKPLIFIAYNIDGNNYFKLRDIGRTFNFGVAWDGENNAIVIDSSKDYKSDKALAATYEARPMVPDFGVIFETEMTDSRDYNGRSFYDYDPEGLPLDCVNMYCEILVAHGFSYISSYEIGEEINLLYRKDDAVVTVGFKPGRVELLVY